MSNPRLFSSKSPLSREEKIAVPQTELSVHLTELNDALSVLSTHYISIKNRINHEMCVYNLPELVLAMDCCETILRNFSNTYVTCQLKNKDKSLEANILSAKNMCIDYKIFPEKLKIFWTRFEEMRTLTALLDAIYISCKTDINHKKIQYIQEAKPAKCSISCTIQ